MPFAHEVEGERAVPWTDPGLYAWHLARYRFAATFAAGKRVLDVGCGEGYGCAALAETAAEVVGVDYSEVAVNHAQQTYQRANLRFEVGDAMGLRPELGEFDLITCFEVIEHLDDDEALLAGIARLLSPGGDLILSTPNGVVDRLVEAISSHEHNHYHINVLTPKQLRVRLERHFPTLAMFGQSYQGHPLYTALKTLDVLNLRHRLVRSPDIQKRVGTRIGRRDVDHLAAKDFRFSRRLVRQSPITLVVAGRSRAGRAAAG